MVRFRMRGTVLGAAVLAALAAWQPVHAAELRIATPNLPASRGDPHTSLTFQFLYVWSTLFDALTYVDLEGKAQPRLATSWRNTSPTTWEFELRPDVKFHNGETLTADAIASSIAYLTSEEGRKASGIVYGSLRHLASARAVDDLTVEITTSGPSPILANEMSALRIVAPKAWADLGREGFANNPSGTGSLKMVSWDEGKLVTAPAPDAWLPVDLEGITWLELPESTSRVQALLSDQVDIALSVAADARPQIEAEGHRVNIGPTPSVSVLAFNLTGNNPAVKDVRVRQALNYAVDKSYIQNLLHGVTVSASQPAPHSVNGYQSDIEPYPYDPEKAKALLEEAGYGDGLKLVAEIVNTLPDLVNTQQWVAANAQRVGVEIELKVITLPDLVARAAGVKPVEGDLLTFNYGAQPSGDMMRSINNFHSCGAKRWACLPEIEDTIKMVNAEFDDAKRDAGLRKIAEFYHEQAPAIWLFEQVELDGIASRVEGYRNENWVIFWEDIALND